MKTYDVEMTVDMTIPVEAETEAEAKRAAYAHVRNVAPDATVWMEIQRVVETEA